MSLLDEKWSFDARSGYVVNENHSFVADPARAVSGEAIAVLPEALALLKAILGDDGGHLPECYQSSGACVGRCAQAQDVLRRAGVLP